ncbi:protein PHYLLO, chloroplastic isoform X2 [Canna indica]|uniref:Protein PHYLLO, chloroplastic isoform X2 n=1 Tax=Canna indica TaxID=4628 RepID=A0AAQ3Q2G7_9LILI|nr:protein PHYLLO, chloroplastic isoform X2 [Canna indica]
MMAVNFFRPFSSYSKPSLIFLPSYCFFSLPRRTLGKSGAKRLSRGRFDILRCCSDLDSQVNAVRVDRSGGLEIDADKITEMEDLDFPVDFCATRALPPALSLEEGFDKIKKAVEELKVNPPRLASGVLRFQVVVPPSIKALNWLCCQPWGLLVYPQFYLQSRESPDSSLNSYSIKGVLEACGIGAAVTVYGSSLTLHGFSLISRYLSIDSPLIRTYGFVGINCNEGSPLVDDRLDSFFFFIPQVEVNEYLGCSILAATLVWDDGMSYTFLDAIHTFELYFHQQMMHHIPNSSICDKFWMNHANGKLPFIGKEEDVQMVYMNAEVLHGIAPPSNSLQKKEVPTSCQFYFRNSLISSTGITMLKSSPGTKCIKDCANINAVWASLIVEECVRLGLTYFCIAPGSRSSPLAISACGHAHTTCFSCYDERSLAFHAVGYAKGSQKPAVVITSSGTAVSNLLPAVVEACHDFTPLILLTADRPPELQDAGANQSIDQVNHFGKFVRFFSLPAATDQVPVRMVLTTIDSAVHYATQVLCGPVHINCPFREPLDDSPKEWKIECLKGLDSWLSKDEPYTKYIKMQHLFTSSHYNGQVAEVVEVIQRAERGLLLIGAVRNEDEIFAASVLVTHLSWPVICDITSGLRLRRVLTPFSETESLFIDHMDHALLSDSVKNWAQPDVVVQIGSRITSKRISQLLEHCYPSSYILVDKHPSRHDPSHIVTHRIQSTITEFAHIIQKSHLPPQAGTWTTFLKALNLMVAQEITFQIHSECSLTEPYVAHIIGELLKNDGALFIGNSMLIRDADMYGRGWLSYKNPDNKMMSNLDKQFQGFRVVGNRGASGIDGLLSTAIGFAVGCNKQVLCLIGDVSFLHDTNGLAILNQRVKRKPITIVVINNHGGGIFSLLPIAKRANPDVLNKYFYTAHDISINNLCTAHSVKYLLVRTKTELQNALCESQQEQNDCVIEVESNIAGNTAFHSILNKFACQTANQTLDFLLGIPNSGSLNNGLSACKIQKVEYSLYRIQLCSQPTSSQLNDDIKQFFHEGFILKIYVDNDVAGLGEVAPIEIHAEDLLDVEEQLRFLVHKLQGSDISFIPLLKGSFSQWIWRTLGIPPSSLFPSVRCGMEMAIVNALAARQRSSFLDVISGRRNSSRETCMVSDGVDDLKHIEICALVDHSGSPKEVAGVVFQLVKEGFTTIKLKVARRGNPVEDVKVIQAIRQTVGYKVKIRADANRKWTYEEAMEFGSCVKCLDLQYIEEPVNREDEIVKFCDESGLPIALDETIDNLKGDFLHKLQNFIHPGIVAIVIKPSVVGGFENAALIAKWAQLHNKMAVVSSAFESSVSLSAYIQFAYYLEEQNAAISRIKGTALNADIAHGLGTYRWLKEDVTSRGLNICILPCTDKLVASVEDAQKFFQYIQMNKGSIQKNYSGEQIRSYQIKVDGDYFSCSFNLLEIGQNTSNMTVVYLHGFLGTSQDWISVMKGVSATAHCISIDLPGHGESQVQSSMDNRSKQGLDLSVESIADALLKLISGMTTGRVILVGYSMGARIALHMALKYKEQVAGAVIISGSPGLRDGTSKRIRAAQDEAKASFLVEHGLECFLDTWYSGNLWKSLRDHPHFSYIKKTRRRHKDIQGLARILSGLSIGKQLSLWDDLKHLQTPVLFIVGEKDTKFRSISQQMCAEIRTFAKADNQLQQNLFDTVVVPDCGHAVHLENPLPLINAVRKFLKLMEHR